MRILRLRDPSMPADGVSDYVRYLPRILMRVIYLTVAAAPGVSDEGLLGLRPQGYPTGL